MEAAELLADGRWVNLAPPTAPAATRSPRSKSPRPRAEPEAVVIPRKDFHRRYSVTGARKSDRNIS